LIPHDSHLRNDAVRYYLDRRTLEAHLTSLLDAARIERARGVQPGAPVFAVFSRQAADKVRDHCRQWQLDARDVEAEIPAVATLRRLALQSAPGSAGHGGTRWLTIGLVLLAISVALTSD
jgi:hypothetical protein